MCATEKKTYIQPKGIFAKSPTKHFGVFVNQFVELNAKLDTFTLFKYVGHHKDDRAIPTKCKN